MNGAEAARLSVTRDVFAFGIWAVQEEPDGFDGVGFGGGLVLPVPLQPGEAEGDAAGVAGRCLHAVEGDLGHHLRPDEHGDPFPVRLELEESLRLPGQGGVGQPFERLATAQMFRPPLDRKAVSGSECVHLRTDMYKFTYKFMWEFVV
jgi:hypothetical protein